MRYEPEQLFRVRRLSSFGLGAQLTLTREFKNFLKKLWIFKKDPQYSASYTEYNPKVVIGYDCFLTNRKYKYLHFKNGGTWRQLHEKGKYSARVIRSPTIVHMHGRSYYVIVDHNNVAGVRYQEIKKPGSRKGRKAPARKGPIPRKREKVLTPFGPVYAPPTMAVPVIDSPKLPKSGTFSVGNDGRVYLSYLGGQTTLLPAKHHKKYWYFLRKNGRYHFSEHHPYGDEHRLILADKSRGYFPSYDQSVVGSKTRTVSRKTHRPAWLVRN